MRFALVSLTLALSLAACTKQSLQEPTGGSAILSWDPVKKDTSGKALRNLAGYKIHYGPSAKAMWYTIKVQNPGQTTYVVTDLFPGTWYFTVSAYTTSGTESAPSNVASKTIH
jgi:fibronectin type III domain protein